MPNLDQWINQQSDINKEEEFTTSSNFENDLLSMKDELRNLDSIAGYCLLTSFDFKA
jgi:hypothetical protein